MFSDIRKLETAKGNQKAASMFGKGTTTATALQKQNKLLQDQSKWVEVTRGVRKAALQDVVESSKAYQQLAGNAKKAAQAEQDAANKASKRATFNQKFGKGFGAGFGTAAASSLGNIPVLGEAATGGLVANFTGGSVAAGALGGAIVGLGAALVSVTADVTTFNNALRLQQKALANTVETSDELEAAFAAINGVSQDFVVPIGEATAQFTKLNAAARASGFGVKEVEEVYRGLAAANVALGGNSERLQGILLATQQVFSKGKVQAEELRGQIGERLSGAFAKFAKSAGLSTSQLDKALEKGEVSLEDFVRFSKSLLEEYEEDAKTLADAPENAAARLQLAMDNLKVAMGPILTDIGNMFINLANTAVEQLTRMFNAINSARTAAAQKQAAGDRQLLQEGRAELRTRQEANQENPNAINQFLLERQSRAVDQLMKNVRNSAKTLKDLTLPEIKASGSPLEQKLETTNPSKTGGGSKSKTAQYKSQAAQLLIQKQYLEDILKLETMTAVGTSRQMEDQQFLLRALEIEIDLKRDLAEIDLEKLDAVDKQLKIDNRLLEAKTERKILDRDELQAAFDRTEAFEEQVKELENAIALESAVTDELKRQAELKIAMAEIEGSDLNEDRKNTLKQLTENLFQVRADNADPLNQYFNQLKERLGDTRGQIAELAQTIETELASAMSRSITGLIDGTTTVQEAFSEMFANIGKAFIDMATEMIAKALIMKAVGAVTSMFGGGGGGGGGWNNPSDFNSIIQLPSYSGGGSTGNAPRSGGIDGRGGFPAILHPQETVVDHTGAMGRYSAGNATTAAAMAPMAANVTYSGPTLNFNGDDYIPRSEAPALVAAGAKQGQARAMNTLKNSRSQRQKLGM